MDSGIGVNQTGFGLCGTKLSVFSYLLFIKAIKSFIIRPKFFNVQLPYLYSYDLSCKNHIL